jgi:hypothetical protein
MGQIEKNHLAIQQFYYLTKVVTCFLIPNFYFLQGEKVYNATYLDFFNSAGNIS